MRNLYEYICEGKQIREFGIDLEIFKHFFNEWVLSDDGYNEGKKNEEAMAAYDSMVDALRPYVRNYKDAIKAMYNYCIDFCSKLNDCGVYNITDEIIHLLYDKICSMPANKAENLLGVGEEGIAVEQGDKVIKFFFGDKIRKDKLEFYNVCKKGIYKVFPKVYRIGKGYVIMEKLKMYTDKCNEYQYIIDKVYSQVYDGNYNIKDFTGIEKEVVEWLENVKEAVSAVTKFADLGDICEKNFGEREDGSIVYFDI